MAALGTISVPLYAKLGDEYQPIGSMSLDVHGELSGDKVVLTVEDAATALNQTNDKPPPVIPIPVIDHGKWAWHKPITRMSNEPPVKRSFWRRGAVDDKN